MRGFTSSNGLRNILAPLCCSPGLYSVQSDRQYLGCTEEKNEPGHRKRVPKSLLSMIRTYVSEVRGATCGERSHDSMKRERN